MSGFSWLCHRSRHCLPVRPGRCAARTDHLRVPWPSMARSRSSSSAGDQAPLTCVGCVVWGGSVPGGAPKKCRGRRRSQRARECGSPRRAVRRVWGGRGLSRPRDSGVRTLTGGGVWKERRAGQKAAPPAPAALRSRRRAVCAAGAADGARLGPFTVGRCTRYLLPTQGATTIAGPLLLTTRLAEPLRSAIICKKTAARRVGVSKQLPSSMSFATTRGNPNRVRWALNEASLSPTP